MNREDKLYQELFGDIPNNPKDRLVYILGKRLSDMKFHKNVESIVRKFRRTRWKTLKFTMWRVMKPSARPRANSRAGYIHMYVPRAKENGDWFVQFAERENLPKIETPCKIKLAIYEKTPSSFSLIKKVLAEMGIIRPWKRTGDIDNFIKCAYDMFQHSILKDDCLVIGSEDDLYYSIKPHCDVEITYMEKFPDF